MLPINKRKLIISIIIGISASAGDKNSIGQENRLAAAIVDNFSHATIGFLTWIGVLCAEPSFRFKNSFLEFIICAILSSLIDVDHFVEAKSLDLKDAVSLNKRPFLHCTSTTLSVAFSVLFWGYQLGSFGMYQFGWILVAAVLSHHIRDSSRRGFWLWPFGSTPPTPYGLYIITQMLLPYALSFLMNQFSMSGAKSIDDAVNIV